MAKNQKQFEGWSYVLQEEESLGLIATPRTRRSRKIDDVKLVLKRNDDGLELKDGDCILVDQRDQSAVVAIIKEIRFGIDDFIEINVMWFVSISEVELAELPKKDQETVEEGGMPSGFCSNDLFITALQDKIYVSSIVDRVNVISSVEFESITIDESNKDSTFVCRRGCDASANNYTDPIDWRELQQLLIVSGNQFYQKVKALTVAPTVKRSSVTPSFQRSKSKKVVSYKEPDTSESSDNEYDSFESDVEVDSMSSDASEDVDISDDERKKGRKQRKTSAPVTPLKRQRLKPKKIRRAIKRELSSDLPSLPIRSRLNFGDDSDLEEDSKTPVFKQARKRLHASAKLKSLPCRELESQELYLSLEQAIESEIGTCIYVSGTPGTGKTATIREVVKQLVEDYLDKDPEEEKFDYVEINGLKLVSPQSSYEVLWEKISGDRILSFNAISLLDTYFSTKDKTRKPLIVLMDELDQIVTKTQTVMYNFFNWPSYLESKLIVIAVANTMDLPERMLTNKISSRLGLKRLQFPGYDHKQLTEIIKHRLQDLERLNSGKLVIKKDAIEFAARKVASVSGDARRALIICRRAIEIAETEYYKIHGEKSFEDLTYTVQITHIMKAVNETTNSPITQFLESLSFVSKLFISCLLRRKKKSGLAENTMDSIIDEMDKVITMQTSAHLNQELAREKIDLNKMLYGVSRENLRIEGFSYVVQELIESGILLQNNSRGERLAIVKLNISDDEIINVLKKDENLRGITSF